jgi:putative membrane protein
MTQHAHLRMLAVAAATAAMVSACDRADRDAAVAEMDSALDTARARLDTLAGRIGREYTDAELTGFLNAFSDTEIEVGQLGTSMATDAQVRNFARRTVTDYRALKIDVRGAAQRLNLTPSVPANDENLAEDHQAGMRDLRAKAKGQEFDKAFMEHEIRMHRKIIDEVQDALARTQTVEMRTLLEKARTTLQGHLTTAQELEAKVGA